LALVNKLPFVQLVEGAGANLLSYRVEKFIKGGNFYRNLARLSAAGIAGVRDGKICASINGRITPIHAAGGARLATGEPVFTLEAMKMEHTHAAPIAGTLRNFTASLNDQVSAARVIAEIEPSEGTP
jgi:geranyl-CoA carboxylase alpha subunit